MGSQLAQAYRDGFAQIPNQAVLLALCAGLFLALSIGLRGLAGSLKNARAAGEQSRINLIFWALDLVTVGPLLAVMAVSGGLLLHRLWPHSPLPGLWAWMGPVATVSLTIFLGDFVAYWRHRAQHSAWLWPAHAVHHSGT
jgi:sterol desaturase/sphingolipid hydroxylase (fatty acid hydroxylase superfamily)